MSWFFNFPRRDPWKRRRIVEQEGTMFFWCFEALSISMAAVIAQVAG
jgi:hypothetical protein